MCYVNIGLKYFAKRSPKNFVRIIHPLSFIFLLGMTAFFFGHQMFYIAPQLYGGVLYKICWIVAIFITYNILGNMLACYHTNSSVESLPKDRQVPTPGDEHTWIYCKTCQKLMPPRSWHCDLCRCCILKRDHHCIFTGTCIGHNNHRYFFWLTFYLTLGLIGCIGSHFLHAIIHGFHLISFLGLDLINMIFQHNGPEPSLYYKPVFGLCLLLCCLPGIMLAWQIQILCTNSDYYNFYSQVYDLGLKKNCKIMLGERGLWTFLSPSVKSPLPHDGTQWQMKHSV
ncbi:probable palmitoyltransferase ZDHHC24 [Drosophila ficusphila]|uniref:probable palmitoyltransferase ZDHHC24 n=1 Tax=Drosophila ficusphila TaxID=30025 RepID=UPI0007E60424|nr:probable palmitoyltransferase ZDHHC24 [Drosophila ficusphila]